MERIIINRIYLPESTLGAAYRQSTGEFLCFTVELPWRDNERQVSCIPEGVYTTKKEVQKTRTVYRLANVPGRSGVLIHIANRPSELRGCIAPNMALVGDKEGLNSGVAMKKLLTLGDEIEVEIRLNNPIQPPQQ